MEAFLHPGTDSLGKKVVIKIFSLCLVNRNVCNNLQTAQNKTPPSSLPQIEIEGTEFHSGISYVARVRCKVSEIEDSYHSQWSDWSQTTVFQREGKNNVVFALMSWVAVVLLLLGCCTDCLFGDLS